MPASIAPVTVNRQWTNIYSETSIDVGTPLVVYLESGAEVRLAISESAPASDVGGTEILGRDEVTIDGGQVGLWAISYGDNAKLLVQENSGGAIRRSPFSDIRTVDGDKAITTQPFTELNSKTGKQFEFSALFTSITALTGIGYIGIETGDSPVIIKQREIFGDFLNMRIEMFRGATYTSGTTINSFNNNDLVVNVSGVEIKQAPTVTDVGTAMSPAGYLLGTESVGNRVMTSLGGAAGETILAPNTKYLYKLSNLAVGVVSLLALRVYYYEGPISTQIP